MALVACTQCLRHVRTSEGACPFCGAATSTLVGLPALPGRMSRAAALAFGASLSALACSGSTAITPSSDAGQDVELAQPLYGAPAPDASFGDGSVRDASTPDADDAGSADTGTDTGNIQPPYGAPAYGLPPTDSGAD
jgi:hypothetical protein